MHRAATATYRQRITHSAIMHNDHDRDVQSLYTSDILCTISAGYAMALTVLATHRNAANVRAPKPYQPSAVYAWTRGWVEVYFCPVLHDVLCACCHSITHHALLWSSTCAITGVDALAALDAHESAVAKRQM